MFFLYSLIIRIFGFAISFASLFNEKVRRFVNGRKNQDLSQIEQSLAHWRDKRIYWIHVASYGEFEMAKPVIRALQELGDHRFVVSFFSPSGYDQVDIDPKQFLKIYLPIDHYASQQKLIEIIDPYKVIFIKYDFWFNLLRCLKLKSIPYYFISIHLKEDHYLLGKFMRPFLDLIGSCTQLYAHNAESVRILKEADINNISLLGDSRLSQVFKNKSENHAAVKWHNSRRTITFGSILEEEFEMVCNFINSSPDWNIIIAPHEIDDKTMKKLTSNISDNIDLYSKQASSNGRVMVVDTMGDLRYLYRGSSVAYVGGGFDKGPHNVLEPMVYGVQTIIGPNIEKFPMAQYLRQEKLLTVISSENEFSKAVTLALNMSSQEIENKMKELHEAFTIGFDNMVIELN